ncbi:uncharacterized protein N0V89_010465 [Didymosphaeria variabile]|uniref:Trichothecene 3-O-acetyltransferase-like N-terminal domain-containing protein n=1 Tax=Didymosphaeria variabile TaxID=1932322 RepID=A0A9W9C670_9PLEO|nr:uncharacterized protein N0V89_010465 [Didymosphaeria variabile]KAJ4346534.1 hypothetical protein N0V89_010465 [Didymosphaeria variabile]
MEHFPLDVFGNNPRLSRLYTQLCFCFPLPNCPRRTENTITHLQNGLNVLTSNFPWVAGQVIQADDGAFTIVPLEKSPKLRVQDRSSQLPTFEEYRNMGFPFKWLDEKDIASHSTLPDGRDVPAPVLALQATFITGGVFLTFSAQHNCMDMAGQCQMILLFAKACHEAVPFTSEEIKTGNLSRKRIIPPLDDLPKISEELVAKAPNSKPSHACEAEAEAKPTWSYFLLSCTTLLTLKLRAQKDIHTTFISTDDALCAFIWQQVTKARLCRLQDMSASTQSTFERQVDVRKHLGLPTTYTGNAVYKTSTTQSIENIISKSLGYLASELRASLSPTPDLGHSARKAATILYQQLQSNKPDAVTVTRGNLPAMDIKMSSWAKEDCYNFDFGGVLGKPEAVRRPNFEGWEGLSYFMPKSRDGEIAVAVCLRDEELRFLQIDEEFSRFARYVG